GAVWLPQKSALREITGQGVPASLNMMTVALGIMIITWFLSRFSENAVAAYGVATRIEQIVLMPTIGLNAATMSLVAQNGGARLFGRVYSIVRSALIYGAIATALGGVLLWFGGTWMMSLFTDDANVIAIGAHYLRIAAFAQYAYILLFVNMSALQGMKKPAFALWIGLYRQLVAPIFSFWFTIEILGWGLDGVWWSVFAVTWSAALLSVWWARRLIKQLERAEELRVA
ncbi:MAG: Na+-driven multidrug efflux pump, partial [Candidatus Krumholzibacteriia bacterium]